MYLQTSLVRDLVDMPLLLVIEGQGEGVLLVPIVLSTDFDTGGVFGHLEQEHHFPAFFKTIV